MMNKINKLEMKISILKDKNEQLRKTVGTWQSRTNKFRKYLMEIGKEVEVDLIEHGYEP